MGKLGNRIMIRLGVVVGLSIGIGLYSKVTTFNEDGAHGAYLGPWAVEYTEADGRVNVWSCSETAFIPSWRCPAWEGAIIHGRPVTEPLAGNGDGWQAIPLGVAMALHSVTGREDWSGCMIRFGDASYVRCPDGMIETS